MRIPSLYSVYRAFYAYPVSSSLKRKRLFALAIDGTNNVIEKVLRHDSYHPIHDYEELPKNNPLTLTFLRNFSALSENDIKSIDYYDASIYINPWELDIMKHREITISSPFLVSKKDGSVIFLTYGRPEVIEKELEVFKTMTKTFSISPSWPSNFDVFSYWDLSSGKCVSTNYSKIKTVPKDKLDNTIKYLVG